MLLKIKKILKKIKKFKKFRVQVNKYFFRLKKQKHLEINNNNNKLKRILKGVFKILKIAFRILLLVHFLIQNKFNLLIHYNL